MMINNKNLRKSNKTIDLKQGFIINSSLINQVSENFNYITYKLIYRTQTEVITLSHQTFQIIRIIRIKSKSSRYLKNKII